MFLEQPAELTHVSFIILQQLLQSIWDKVFKNGLSKICGRQPFKFLEDCLPQILLGPFLNTFSHIRIKTRTSVRNVWSLSQSAFTCWKLTVETLKQSIKYVQS